MGSSKESKPDNRPESGIDSGPWCELTLREPLPLKVQSALPAVQEDLPTIVRDIEALRIEAESPALLSYVRRFSSRRSVTELYPSFVHTEARVETRSNAAEMEFHADVRADHQMLFRAILKFAR